MFKTLDRRFTVCEDHSSESFQEGQPFDASELPEESAPQPQRPWRRRAGLALALLWLIACFGALSGKCGPAPSDEHPTGDYPTASPPAGE